MQASAVRDAAGVQVWDHEAAVVVVGFGCAGACVAIEAAEGGADGTFFGRQAGRSAARAVSR